MLTGTINLTADPSITLTYFVHEFSEEFPDRTILPAMLVIPGGGYEFCSDGESEPIAMAYYAAGYQTFVLNYSTGNDKRWPMPLEEANLAIEIIIKNAKEWLVDTHKIAAIGFSAGGHLAASLSTMGTIRPAAVVLAYPCILDSINEILAFPVSDLTDKVDDETSPAFIFATRTDDLVPIANSLAYAAALDEAGRPFEIHIFAEGPHGFSLGTAFTAAGRDGYVLPDASKWFDLSLKWLETVL
ncbi:MAG: alpha/beta hydrolase [Clostridiales Family XIII bacterium]|jgi:acetyl esterase/lipase|nr:alpha/beta hydrolase [Clostridiales Family XIII bacterium]